MIFFTDENFSARAAKLLEVFDSEHEIRTLLSCFPQGTPDVKWIAEIAAWESKPAVISGDGRILRNQVELASLRQAKLTWFSLACGWTNLPWNDYAAKIIQVWPKVVAQALRTRRPTVFEISARTLKIAEQMVL